MEYTVRVADAVPPLDALWPDPVWAQAETLKIQHFRPESSDHRPQTSARLLHDARGIYGSFRVQDRYGRCLRTQYHAEVWKDSCVEFFAQPRPDCGYFNFEFNCGGALLCCHITDPDRWPAGLREFANVPSEQRRVIQVRSSLPRRIEPEIMEPVVWTLIFSVPFALFEHYRSEEHTSELQSLRHL